MPAVSTPSVSHQVPIELGDRSYPISIGSGLLSDPATWDAVPAASQALIVTNLTVAPLYAQQLRDALAARHKTIHVVALPDPYVCRLASFLTRNREKSCKNVRRGLVALFVSGVLLLSASGAFH